MVLRGDRLTPLRLAGDPRMQSWGVIVGPGICDRRGVGTLVGGGMGRTEGAGVLRLA